MEFMKGARNDVYTLFGTEYELQTHWVKQFWKKSIDYNSSSTLAMEGRCNGSNIQHLVIRDQRGVSRPLARTRGSVGRRGNSPRDDLMTTSVVCLI
jgi:hypothetical protein